MDIALWVLVAALALYAGWLTVPRPVELDWERFFKLAMVTVIRGPLEEEEASAEQWMETSRQLVWYHPAARQLDAKVADPAGYEPPFPALAGERALLEVLAGLPLVERLHATFALGADDVLYDDPANLGEDWQLSPILGPDADWDSVASWSEKVIDGLRRRHEVARWVLMGADPLVQPLRLALGDEAVLVVGEDAAEVLDEQLAQLSDRAVFVAHGERVDHLVRLLHARPDLRDKALAIVALQATFDAAWMAENFDHVSMDTELSRATPYFHLWFGEDLRGLPASRWPDPEVPATGRVSVAPIDLGLLPGHLDATDPVVLGRALLLTVTARVALSG